MRIRALLAAGVVAAAGVIAPAAGTPSAQTPPIASMVRTWNANALTALGGAGQPPNVAVLHMAMVQGAVYDAVNSIDGGHEPLNDVPAASSDASMDAAVATAAYLVLIGLAPAPALPQPVLDMLEDEYGESLGSVTDDTARAKGMAAGAAAAEAMLDARATDGRYVPSPLTGGTEPGEWRPLSLAPGANDPNSWISEVTPFTLSSTSQFRTPGPRNLNSAAYAHEYDEVKTLGAALPLSGISPRTEEQDDIARFFNVNPVEMLNRNFRTISETEGLSLVEEARLFGMANVSGADAIINCWNDKRFHSFWRPITAIREGENDGNRRTIGDPLWTPLETTPPYPDHTSGYNCVAGSFTNAAKAFFGSDQMDFKLARTVAPDTLTRDYHRLTDVVDDTIDARVFQGLHFRSADVQGARIGRQVAEWVAGNAFQPVD